MKTRIFYIVMALVLTVALAVPLVGPGAPPAQADDTGWKSPTVTGSWDNEWTNPTNAFSDDGSYATENTNGQDQGYGGFGFTVPDCPNTAIVGIAVQVEAKSCDTFGCNLRIRLSWNNGAGGSWTSRKTVDLTGVDTVFTRGGPTDTWGHNWQADQISDSNFVVEVEYDDPGTVCSCASGDRVSLDYIKVKVYYDLESPQLCTGWQGPTANAADTGGDGNGFEVNPGNAYNDGGGNAANMNGVGDRHRYGNYSFSIPAGSTIDGIAVRLDWWLSFLCKENRIIVDLSWDGGSTWTSTRTASTERTSDGNPTDIEGGPSDTWGHTWDVDQLSASNFMVRLKSACYVGGFWCAAPCSTQDWFLDWVPVRVCYTLPDGYISLTPETDTNCVGSDHTVTATIVGDTGGTTVTFDVTAGPNSGDMGNDTTDICGMATWTYTGDGGAGTDTIVASYTSVNPGPITSDPVTKTWVADPGNPTTQLVMMLDGSGSIDATEWSIMINGLAQAVNSSECVPADGSVELTVIQFATNARLEVGPVVIDDTDVDPTNDASAVAGQIESITKYPGDGYTCIACAIYLAQDVLLNHPPSNFNICRKQALNLVTDGAPNRRANSAGGTGPSWEWQNSGSGNAANSAVNARNYAIAQLQMTEDQDEFDAEGVGITTDNKNWLRDSIVWPQPGYEDWLPTGPGWVHVVSDFQEFADTICEKIQIILEPELDFGDAPDSYGTLLASNGARHLLGAAAAPIWMGPIVDAELDGQPTPLADGDDLNPIGAPDDEDGVAPMPSMLPGDPAATVTVDGGPTGGMLDAWIDFNGNGIFEHPAEHLWGGASQLLVLGPNPLAFAVPGDAVPGQTYARFRLSINGGLLPTGLATEGEVEDYSSYYILEPTPEMTIDKDVVGVAPVGVAPGGTVQYTINVTNTGIGTAINVSIWDTLPTWFTYASTDSIADTGTTRSPTVDPTPGVTNPLWGDWDIPSGDSVVITFTADVDSNIPVGTYQNTAYADGDNFDEIDDIGNLEQDADTPPGQDPEVDENVFVAEEPPPLVTGVPTLSQWGMIGMGILFAAFLIWTVRRRWVVSADRSQG